MTDYSEIFEKYVNELNQDVALDQFNLKDSQLGLPGKKHKWAGRLIRHKIELNKFTLTRDIRVKEIITQIKDRSPTPLTDISVNRIAVKHESIVEIDNSIQQLKLIIEFLEKTEKTLSSMTFDISNIVKLITLETT